MLFIMPMTLSEYIESTGKSQSEIGRMAGGVSQGMVSQWVTGHRPISVKRALLLERATNGVLTVEALCPGVFGGASEAAA